MSGCIFYELQKGRKGILHRRKVAETWGWVRTWKPSVSSDPRKLQNVGLLDVGAPAFFPVSVIREHHVPGTRILVGLAPD